jgi:uncharacterized membrane protein
MKASTKKKIKTTVFWSGIASSLIIFVQSIATLLGYELPADTIAQIIAVVNSLLAILSFSGVLVDSKEVDSFQNIVAKVRK